MQKHPIDLTKFNLNWLPNTVLMNPGFKKFKDFFFNDYVFNIKTMKIEVKENNQEGDQKTCDYWNKVLTKKFKLKLFEHDGLQMSKANYKYVASCISAFPPEVNWFIIDNPTIIRVKNRYDVDDFSVFKHKITSALYVIYNSEEQLSDHEVIKFIANNIFELEVRPSQKFIFEYTSKMKDFINKNLPNWAFEVIGMDNKTWPSFIAKLHTLSGNELDIKSNYRSKTNENFKKIPLVLTDLEQMKLFTKLTEKTSTDDEPSKLMLIRQQIPNFYKNLNVAYSWQIQEVMKMLPGNEQSFNLFRDHYLVFYLEIVEAGELYVVKNEKSQKIISKMLNNIDVKKMNVSTIFNYTPLNGRSHSDGEMMWIRVLNSNKNRTYSLVNMISSIEFKSRVEWFMHSYHKEQGGKKCFNYFEGWKLNDSYIKHAYINLAKQNIGNSDLYLLPYSQKDHITIPKENFVTRRERFEVKNPVAGEFKQITENIDKNYLHDFILKEWRNHKIPDVFANMRKDLGFMNTLNKLIDMFEPWTLEIDYKSFKDYFEDENIRDMFFNEGDYEYDDERETIIIKNWLMIPILGTLKMFDDYKNGQVKEGFEFEPYGSFTDPKNEKPYVQIQLDQIRKGECGKEFIGEPCSLADYEKIYELNNWHAHLTFNWVKYFYFVQDKQSSIVVKEVSIHIFYGIHDIYKFLFSSNPIDLITIALKFNYQSFLQTYGL
jgi:hypothetical protein